MACSVVERERPKTAKMSDYMARGVLGVSPPPPPRHPAIPQEKEEASSDNDDIISISSGGSDDSDDGLALAPLLVAQSRTFVHQRVVATSQDVIDLT